MGSTFGRGGALTANAYQGFLGAAWLGHIGLPIPAQARCERQTCHPLTPLATLRLPRGNAFQEGPAALGDEIHPTHHGWTPEPGYRDADLVSPARHRSAPTDRSPPLLSSRPALGAWHRQFDPAGHELARRPHPGPVSSGVSKPTARRPGQAEARDILNLPIHSERGAHGRVVTGIDRRRPRGPPR